MLDPCRGSGEEAAGGGTDGEGGEGEFVYERVEPGGEEGTRPTETGAGRRKILSQTKASAGLRAAPAPGQERQAVRNHGVSGASFSSWGGITLVVFEVGDRVSLR